MSYLMKAATDIACTMIKAQVELGVTELNNGVIAKESADLALKIKQELSVHHEGVCDPDALTADVMDKLIAKHMISAHGLLHSLKNN